MSNSAKQANIPTQITPQRQIKSVVIDIHKNINIGSTGLLQCISQVEHFLIFQVFQKERLPDKAAICVDHAVPSFVKEREATNRCLPSQFLRFFIGQVLPTNPSQFLRFFISQVLPTNPSMLLYAMPGQMSIEIQYFFAASSRFMVKPRAEPTAPPRMWPSWEMLSATNMPS